MSSLNVPSNTSPFENLSLPFPFLRSSMKSPTLTNKYLHRTTSTRRCRQSCGTWSGLWEERQSRCKASLFRGTGRLSTILRRLLSLIDSRVCLCPPFCCSTTLPHSTRHPDNRKYPSHASAPLAYNRYICFPLWTAPRRTPQSTKDVVQEMRRLTIFGMFGKRVEERLKPLPWWFHSWWNVSAVWISESVGGNVRNWGLYMGC